MPDYLQDYKEYYAVRANRFANNENYKNSFQAEKNLSDAMNSCQKLEEFQIKVGNLPNECAIALVKDEALMENKHYTTHEEPYRKIPSDNILAQVDSLTDVQEIISLALNSNSEASNAITADEYNQLFIDSLHKLDMIEVNRNVEVPEKYKAKIKDWVKEEQQLVKKHSEQSEQSYRNFIPDWKENPDACMENRHKRLIPYNDTHLKEKIEMYKQILES